MLGRAISQASETRAGVELYCSATRSRAPRIRRPRSFKYFSAILWPRGLWDKSSFERYLPVRKPLARE